MEMVTSAAAQNSTNQGLRVNEEEDADMKMENPCLLLRDNDDRPRAFRPGNATPALVACPSYVDACDSRRPHACDNRY